MQRLTEEVQSLIRTGVALPSITQVVEELVLNSIDAGASNIAVRVDLSCFKIQVVDNGHGITEDQFELIGERYATSKCHSAKDLEMLNHYGYRGEALASLKDSSSFLEIVSRAKGSCVTISKCFLRGNRSHVSKLTTCRPSVGTTITVHDLFYNLPVRQIKLNLVMEMERIRYRIASLALIWPKITVSLRNDSVGQILLQTRKCNGTLGVFCSLFPTVRPTDMLEITDEKGEFSLWGFISKECHSQKDIQFVYINKRLVINSCIHKQVNRILGQSLITKRKEQSATDPFPSTGSPSKHIDLFGVYLLNISCPFDFYDITFDPKKTLVEFKDDKKLMNFIQDVIYSILRRENLLPGDLTAKTFAGQKDNSNEESQENIDKQLDDEKSRKIFVEDISTISHSDIIFSKPVKKLNKNLLHSFDDSNENLSRNDEAVSEIVPVEMSQSAVLPCKDSEESILRCRTDEHRIKNNSDFDDHTDASAAVPSTSCHENISQFTSSENEEPCTIRPVRNSNKGPGLNMPSYVTGKSNSNKPELSKISVDKSLPFVSTLSRLREFASSKGNKTSIQSLDAKDLQSVTRNAEKPSSYAHGAPMIHTLTELKSAAASVENVDEEPIASSSTELKKTNESTNNVENVPTGLTLTALKTAACSTVNVSDDFASQSTTTSNCLQGSGSSDEVREIQALADFKRVPPLKAPEKSKTVSTILTLTELKKSTHSYANDDAVLKTPCNINQNLCNKKVSCTKTKHHEHPASVKAPENTEKVLRIHTLTELKKNSQSFTDKEASIGNVDGEPKASSSTELKKNIPTGLTFTALNKAARSTVNVSDSDDFASQSRTTSILLHGSSGEVREIQALADFKRVPPLKAPEKSKTVSTILTLTELKKTKHSYANDDAVFKTPCNIDQNLCNKEVSCTKPKHHEHSGNVKASENTEDVLRIHTLTELKNISQSFTDKEVDFRTPCNSSQNLCDKEFTLKQTIQNKHQDNNMTLMEHSGLQIPTNTINLNDNAECPCPDNELRNPCILDQGMIECSLMERSNNPIIFDKDLDKVTKRNAEIISVPSNLSNETDCVDTVGEFHGNLEVHHTKANDRHIESNESAGETEVCIDIASTADDDIRECDEVKMRKTKTCQNQEDVTTESQITLTSQPLSYPSLQPLSLIKTRCVTKHKSPLNLNSTDLKRTDNPSCSQSIATKRQALLESFSPYFHRKLCENKTLSNNEDCNVYAEPFEHPLSSTRSPISYHHSRVHGEGSSPHYSQLVELQERSINAWLWANQEREIDCNLNKKEMNEELSKILEGTFNLKPLIGSTLTNLHFPELSSRKQLSHLQDDKRLSFDISLNSYPSSSGCSRKRKSVLDVELSALAPSPKKFHFRLFEKDLIFLRDNLLSNSLFLKSLFGQYTYGKHAGLGKYGFRLPALTAGEDLKIPSTPVQIVDCDVTTANFTSLNPLVIKTLWTSQRSSCQYKCSPNDDCNVTSSHIIDEPADKMVINQDHIGDCEIIQSKLANQNDRLRSRHDQTMGNRSDVYQSEAFENDGSLLRYAPQSSQVPASPHAQTSLSMTQKQTALVEELHSDTWASLNMDNWKNPVFKKHKMPCQSCPIIPSEASIAKACYSFINGLEFTGGMLQSVKVIGQVEMKFIACIIATGNQSSNNSDMKQTMLVLFDQHAVHERIRLEALTIEAEESIIDSDERRLKRAEINPPISLTVTKDEARIVKAFQTNFQRLGVDFVLGESVQSMQQVVIQSLPLCMTQRDGDGKQRDEEEMTRNARDLIQDQIQHIKATHGVHRRIPLSVHRVLCSQACRGAIKFGDPVNLAKCKQLMRELSECRLPFQCAHGRPSIVPMVNLTSLEMNSERRIVKPKLGKLSAYRGK